MKGSNQNAIDDLNVAHHRKGLTCFEFPVTSGKSFPEPKGFVFSGHALCSLRLAGEHLAQLNPPQRRREHRGCSESSFRVTLTTRDDDCDELSAKRNSIILTSISQNWGTTSEERRLRYPCDAVISTPDVTLFRGVTVKAPARTVYRWLCQLRVAPYSYDSIDNVGKQSPQALIAGLDELVVGQEVMTIFALVDFERNRHLTIRTKQGSSAARTFGDIAVSYLIEESQPDVCRLLVKLAVNYAEGMRGRLMGVLLPWGDLFMMRRQLLNLKQLAEQTTTEER